MTRIRIRIASSIAALALAASVAGCTSSNAAQRIAAFAAGVGTCTEGVSAAFVEVEDVHYRSQASTALLKFDAMQFNPNSITPFLKPEEINARLTVLAGLKLYAEKLSEIMGNSQLTSLDDQAKAFGTSLTKLDASDAVKKLGVPQLSATEIDIFTTAVRTLGQWFIDWKRSREVKALLTDMQPYVENICKLLAKDIGEKPSGSGLRNQIHNDFVLMTQTRSDWLWKEKGNLDPIHKRDEVNALLQLVRDRQSADRTLESTYKALTTLQETHKQLVHAFDNDAPNLETRLQELIAEGKQIQDFYSSLKSK